MQGFNDNELKVFKQIASLSQPHLKKVLTKSLQNANYQVIEKDKYIIGIGNIPIALVAHMDTVFKTPPKNFFYDQKKHVLWSPEGLGADDRAGVYAIVEIIKAGYRPHVIFTCDEEIGAYGAYSTVKDGNPFGDLKYIIELDRQGEVDCVFYDCDNKDFVSYVEEFGFIEDFGTFTDISIICPAWTVAGVNLSVGYIGEHAKTEILYTNILKATINKVIKMLDAASTAPTFKYIPCSYSGLGKYSKLLGSDQCDCCGDKVPFEGLIPVYDRAGYTYLCPTCLKINDVQWCQLCGEAYMPYETEHKTDLKLCQDCMREVYNDELVRN